MATASSLRASSLRASSLRASSLTAAARRSRNDRTPVASPIVPTRYDIPRSGFADLLDGEPRYRVDQVWHALYDELREPSEMTTLPKALRARLATELPPSLEPIAESVSDKGTTVKWLWGLGGRRAGRDRAHALPRSSHGLRLEPGGLRDGVRVLRDRAGRLRAPPHRRRDRRAGRCEPRVGRATRAAGVSNVVFMGMGEPFANYDRTWQAVERLHDDIGLSARHLTVSTVGITPGIRRLATERLPVNLAVSLHAANDELRNELVPINRRYPARRRDRRVPGLDRGPQPPPLVRVGADRRGQRPPRATRASSAALARPLRAHVNLIPLNPTPGWPTPGTPASRSRRVSRPAAAMLGVNATVRANRGTDIDAACGQLAAANVSRPVTLGPPNRRAQLALEDLARARAGQLLHERDAARDLVVREVLTRVRHRRQRRTARPPDARRRPRAPTRPTPRTGCRRPPRRRCSGAARAPPRSRPGRCSSRPR